MTFTTIEVVNRLRSMLGAESGLLTTIEALREGYGQTDPVQTPSRIDFLSAPAEFIEKSAPLKYPAAYVYCERIDKQRGEAFGRNSGRFIVVTELRVSQDRLDGITEKLNLYVDATRGVLESNVGCLGGGVYLSEDYEVTVEPVRKGGLNYLQTAKIACPVIVSRT